MTRPEHVPECQMRPDLAVHVDRTDGWEHACPLCRACIQGGPEGMDAHYATIHGPLRSEG